jgi:hypothetical protein
MADHVLFDGINWELFAEQQVTLATLIDMMDLIEKGDDPEAFRRLMDHDRLDKYRTFKERLQGILYLLDAIQDSAQEAGYPVVLLSPSDDESE